MNDFAQIAWDDRCQEDCLELIRLAVREDLGRLYDFTTLALVPEQARGAADVVPRRPGVVAGLQAAALVVSDCDRHLQFEILAADGDRAEPGRPIARLAGPVRSLLTLERIVLNFLGRLSGIATLTSHYVAAAGARTRIYDTRKTTPGWRRLEKYAVRCGGGFNHRLNLAAAILIKDNHLAWGSEAGPDQRYSPAEAVLRARAFFDQLPPDLRPDPPLVEIEVDSLEQLAAVLPSRPDIVLLDNMTVEQLCEAVVIRNRLHPPTELEASGGVNLATVPDIAAAGVERISAGALTHSAVWLDIGLDWSPAPGH